jgi:hypothetical protein
MSTQALEQTAVNVSKVLIVLDHLKNNRIEYLLLIGLGHLVGATAYVSERAAGICA